MVMMLIKMMIKNFLRVMALLDKKFRNACKPIINSLERTPDIVNGRLCMGGTQGTTSKMTPRTRGSESTPIA